MNEQKDKVGLNVTKPVSVLNRSLEVNFQGLFKAVTSLGIDAASQRWAFAGKDLASALTAVGLEAKNPEELAWALIFNSLRHAIASLAMDSQGLMPKAPHDWEAFCDNLGFSDVEDIELTISASFFDRPKQLPILEPMQQPLKRWFVGFGADPQQAENLVQLLPTYFVFALHQEWRRHALEYALMATVVETPFTQAAERERDLELYQAWLQKQVQEPMLLEAFGLARVYVDPYAYYRRRVEGGDRYEEREKWERVVVELDAALQDWLRKADKNDAIRVVSGGPGSGKSSFTKMFAARHGERFDFPVLFVPLHQFDLAGDLEKSMEDFVRFQEYIVEQKC